MRLVLFLPIVLFGCTETKPYTEEETKYPEVPTMGCWEKYEP